MEAWTVIASAFHAKLAATGGNGMLRRISAVVLMVAASAGCGGGNSNSGSTTAAPVTEGDQIAQFETLTQEKMKAVLKDPDSAKYKDVHAYRVYVQGQKVFGFCGRVNSKNGFGGYLGYQRFIGSPAMVGLEEQISQFDIAWNQLCNPVNDAGPVAF